MQIFYPDINQIKSIILQERNFKSSLPLLIMVSLSLLNMVSLSLLIMVSLSFSNATYS